MESPAAPNVRWPALDPAARASGCDLPGLLSSDFSKHYAALGIRDGHAPVCAIRLAGSWSRFSFLLGHVSVQTTEHYLGCEQRFRNTLDDRTGLEPGTLEPQ
jgi:hypothetical protein